MNEKRIIAGSWYAVAALITILSILIQLPIYNIEPPSLFGETSAALLCSVLATFAIGAQLGMPQPHKPSWPYNVVIGLMVTTFSLIAFVASATFFRMLSMGFDNGIIVLLAYSGIFILSFGWLFYAIGITAAWGLTHVKEKFWYSTLSLFLIFFLCISAFPIAALVHSSTPHSTSVSTR